MPTKGDSILIETRDGDIVTLTLLDDETAECDDMQIDGRGLIILDGAGTFTIHGELTVNGGNSLGNGSITRHQHGSFSVTDGNEMWRA